MATIRCLYCGNDAIMLAPRGVPRNRRLPYCGAHTPGQGTPLPHLSNSALYALTLVWGTEGATKLHVVNRLGTSQSRAYGYRVVDHLIANEVIKARKDGRGYRLETTQLGRGILGQSPLSP